MDVVAVQPSSELLALQQAAYAVEARLIGDERIPALHEDLAALRAAGLTWLAAVEESRLLGAVGFAHTADEVDVHRLVVAPEAHRRGIGRALVEAVLDRAGGRRVVVATGRDNLPARALYERLAFRHVADEEVLPGLWVTRYEREPTAPARAET